MNSSSGDRHSCLIHEKWTRMYNSLASKNLCTYFSQMFRKAPITWCEVKPMMITCMDHIITLDNMKVNWTLANATV